MKAIRSMPVLVDDHKKEIMSEKQKQTSMKRSYSMLNADQSMRYLMLSVPFVAIPGLNQRLNSVRRSMSRIISQKAIASNQEKFHQHPVTEESHLIPKQFFPEEEEYTASLALAVIAAMLGAFQFGYNSGVINVPQSVIMNDLGLVQMEWALVVAIFAVGGLFGSYMGGRAADTIGRKNFLLINNVLFMAGGLLESLASNLWMMAAGRLMIGIGCGGVTVVVPLYLGEISPASLRGALGTMNQFATVIGILVANLLGRPLGSSPSWRLLLGLVLVPAIIQLLLSPLMVESPRWLIFMDRRAQAQEILLKLRGHKEIGFDLDCFDLSKEDEKQSSDLYSLLTNRALRFPLIVGLGLQLAQQFSGINAVFYYSTGFFEKAHLRDPWLGSVLAATVNVLSTGLAIHMMDRLGRRTLLLISSLGMALSCVALSVALYMNDVASSTVSSSASIISSSVMDVDGTVLFNSTLQPSASTAVASIAEAAGASDHVSLGYVSVICVMMFVIFFEIGLGPIPWLIVAEIFPSKARATAMTAASGLNWISNFIVGISFPRVSESLGKWSFVPFCIFLLLTFTFTVEFVFETRGKTLEEIQKQIRSYSNEDASSSEIDGMNAASEYDNEESLYMDRTDD